MKDDCKSTTKINYCDENIINNNSFNMSNCSYNTNDNNRLIIEDSFEKIDDFDITNNLFFNNKEDSINNIKEKILNNICKNNVNNNTEIEFKNIINSNDNIIKYNITNYSKSNTKLNKLKLLLYQKFINILNANIKVFFKRLFTEVINNCKVSLLVKKGYRINYNSSTNKHQINKNYNSSKFVNTLIKHEDRKNKLKIIHNKTSEKAKLIKKAESNYIINSKNKKDLEEINRFKKEKEIEKQIKLQQEIQYKEYEKLKIKADLIYSFFLKKKLIELLLKNVIKNKDNCVYISLKYNNFIKSKMLFTILICLDKKQKKNKINKQIKNVLAENFLKLSLKKRFFNCFFKNIIFTIKLKRDIIYNTLLKKYHNNLKESLINRFKVNEVISLKNYIVILDKFSLMRKKSIFNKFKECLKNKIKEISYLKEKEKIKNKLEVLANNILSNFNK